MQKVVYDNMHLDFSSIYSHVASLPPSSLLSPSIKLATATALAKSKSPQTQKKGSTSSALVFKPAVFTIEHIFAMQSLQNQFSLEFQRKSNLIGRLFGRSADPHLQNGSIGASTSDHDSDARELSILEIEWPDTSSLSHIGAYYGKYMATYVYL